jgi:hypothetical protein
MRDHPRQLLNKETIYEDKRTRRARDGMTFFVVNLLMVVQLLTCTRGLLSLSGRDKTKVAQQFIAGIARIRAFSSGGTAARFLTDKLRGIFSRADGTHSAGTPFPSNKLLG